MGPLERALRTAALDPFAVLPDDAPPTGAARPSRGTDAPDSYQPSPTGTAPARAHDGIEPLPAPLRFAADAARASLTAGRPEQALTLLDGAWPDAPSAELHALKAEGLLELGRETESLDAAARGVLRSPLAAAPRWVGAQAAVRLDAPDHAAALLGPLLTLADARVLKTPAGPAPAPVELPDDHVEAHVVDESALRALVPKRADMALAALAEQVIVQVDLARAAEREAPLMAGRRRSAFDRRRMAVLAATEAALPPSERAALRSGDGVQRVRAWVAARAQPGLAELGVKPEAASAASADEAFAVLMHQAAAEPAGNCVVAEVIGHRAGAQVRPSADRGLGVQLDVTVDDGFEVAVPVDEAAAEEWPDVGARSRGASPMSAGTGRPGVAELRLLPAPPAAVVATPEGVVATGNGGVDARRERPAPGPAGEGAVARPVPADAPPPAAAPRVQLNDTAIVLVPAGGDVPLLPQGAAPTPAVRRDGDAPLAPLNAIMAGAAPFVAASGVVAPVPDSSASATRPAPAPASSASATPASSGSAMLGASAPAPDPSPLATPPAPAPEASSTATSSAPAAEATTAAPSSSDAPPSRPADATPEVPSLLDTASAPRDLPPPADPALLVAWLGVDAEVTRLGPAAAGFSVATAGVLNELAPRPRPERHAPPVSWRGVVRLTLVGAALVCLAVDRPVPAALLAGPAVWWWLRDGRRAVQLEAGKAATAAR